MSKVNIPIYKLTEEEANTLLNSVSEKLKISNPQFFYPIYKKIIDEENITDTDLKSIVLDSKFKCKEILERLYDSDEEFEDVASDDSGNEVMSGDDLDDDNSNSNSNSEEPTTPSGDSLENVLNDDADVNREDDQVSEEEFNDEELEDAINNTFMATAVIERTNKANGEKTITTEKIHIKKTPLLPPLDVMKEEFIIPYNENNNDESIKSTDDIALKNAITKLNSYNNYGHVESFFLYLGSKLVESGKCPSFPYYYGCINGNDSNYHHNITDEYTKVAGTKWFKNRVKNDFDLLIVEDDVDEYEQEMVNRLNFRKSSTNNSESGSESDTESENIDDYLNDASDMSSDDEQERIKEITDEDNQENNKGDNKKNNKENNNENNILSIEKIMSDLEADLVKTNSVDKSFIKELGDGELEIDLEEESNNNSTPDNSNSYADNSNDNTKSIIEQKGGELPEDFIDELSEMGSEDRLSFADFEEKDNLYFIRCNNMPVSLSLMEKLDNTLDNLLDDEYEMSETEWFSIFFQTAFGLAIAQKYFNFVHNDLHSSNIMFKATNSKHLYFQINNNYYRIPTFGKITKIIDFARGTFKFADRWVFSDQFKEGGEAFGQYDYPVDGTLKNCECKPNPSFDLVRLGTTVITRLDEKPNVREFVEDITLDDAGNSVCYGEDTFDLYVCIANSCHNAIPIDVLSRPEFERFKINKNKIPKGVYIYKY